MGRAGNSPRLFRTIQISLIRLAGHSYGSLERAMNRLWRRRFNMRRREFMALFGGAAASWPVAPRAQQRERVRRIGVLIGVAGDAETKTWVSTFRKRLDELGWTGDGSVQIEERW